VLKPVRWDGNSGSGPANADVETAPASAAAKGLVRILTAPF
jgi:hypothetical protein